jgi:hypothetical protein
VTIYTQHTDDRPPRYFGEVFAGLDDSGERLHNSAIHETRNEAWHACAEWCERHGHAWDDRQA